MDGVISTGSIFFDPFGVVADGLVVGGRSGEIRLGADTTAAAEAAGEELAEMGHGVAGALVETSGLGGYGFFNGIWVGEGTEVGGADCEE